MITPHQNHGCDCCEQEVFHVAQSSALLIIFATALSNTKDCKVNYPTDPMFGRPFLLKIP